MHKSEVIELAVRPRLNLLIDGKGYEIEFPLAAVIQAEEKLGRSLKSPADWFCAPAKDIPALIEAGLSRHHPEVTPAEIQGICDRLNPESYGEVAEALGTLAFPRFTQRYKDNMEKLKAKGEGDSKKVESVAVH